MTNRDKNIAENEAAEVLRDMKNLTNATPMQIAVAAFLRGWLYGLKDARRIHSETIQSPLRDLENPRLCADCNKTLPGPYGTPGVAIARTRNVLLCSNCGTREALHDFAVNHPHAQN
jgi:hypothetical protein